jgi:hypothetical protein
MKRWRGVLVRENEQTGDGRVIAPGALEWADLPLPLAFLVDGDQHVMASSAPVIGNIDRIERSGDDVLGWGVIDDENSEDGRALVDRLTAGTAPGGVRWPLSIDADDWVVQIVATDVSEDEMQVVMVASAAGPGWPVLRAAAGDPDPGDGGGENGVVLFEDAAGAVIERATHLRIRGVTACSVAAFAGAYLELDPDEAEGVPPEAEPGDAPAEVAPVTAAADLASPPSAWFVEPEPEDGDPRLVEQPDGTRAVPLTITDDGQVYGHVAAWGACHVGYLDACVSPPESASGYALFNLGAVHASGGPSTGGIVHATGPLVVNCDHAPAWAAAAEARDHYAHAGMGWADVHVSAGAFGPWVAGALRPDVTPEQVRVLRALSLSGDWRPDGRGGLELVAVLAVNTPGFPIAREALAASGLVPADAREAPSVGLVASGAVGSIVAAGLVYRCADCAKRKQMTRSPKPDPVMVDLAARLDRIERKLDIGLRAEIDAYASGLAERFRNR